MSISEQVVQAYTTGQMQGWLGEEKGREAFAAVRNMTRDDGKAIFHDFKIIGQTKATAGKKSMLYLGCRKVLGKDTPNYPQQIGDCVSFGAKNATEYLQCLDIMMRGVRETWKPIFPPYYYNTSRVMIGGGSMGWSDGSTGAWMAAAVVKYGALFSDADGVPAYSGNVAKNWGYKKVDQKFYDFGQKHLVHSAAQINSWEDLVAAISNGYPCPTASNVGYQMEASSDGFHRRSGSWSHQMCFIGADDNDKDPYALILNNWGDCHGHLKDFDDGHDLPVGVLRVRKKDAMAHINAGETYAYSQFDGLPEQDLDEKLFKVFGSKAA